MGEKLNTFLLVENDSLEGSCHVRTDLEFAEFRDLVDQHKTEVGKTKLSVDEVVALVSSKGHTCIVVLPTTGKHMEIRNEENVIITRKTRFDELKNDITKELDKHLKKQYGTIGNCIYPEKIQGFYIIRYLGASRGRIALDDENRITEITLYESTFDCYLESAKISTQKFLGMIFRVE